MKILFFLIIFLIPVGLAHAEVGKNFDTAQLSSEVIKWTSHTERIFDNNQWKDYLITDTANYTTIETAYGSVKLDKTNCEFSYYGADKIGNKTVIFTDTITAQRATNGTENWQGVNSVNNASCQTSINGTTLTASRTSAAGILEYQYVYQGKLWETKLKATNLSVLTDQKFGFNQTFNLNSDFINYGGSQRNLDNFNGQNFDRIWLEANKAKIINLLTGDIFNFDLGFDNLESVSVFDTGSNKSKLVFTYTHNSNIISPNQTLIIDPTFSSNNPVNDGYTIDGNNDICDSGSVGKNTVSVQALVEINPNVSVEDCYWSFFDYDISSIPTSGYTVIDSDFNFSTDASVGAYNCNYVSMGNTRASDSGANIWTAINIGTTMVSNDPECKTIANNHNVDLGPTGDSLIQTKINAAAGFFTFGVRPTILTVDASDHNIDIDSEDDGAANPKPTLTIVYTKVVMFAVTDLRATDVRYSSADIIWSTPFILEGVIVGYQINDTIPWGNPLTILNANTSTIATTATLTGLASLTNYSLRVSPISNDTTYNATGNIINITTDVNPNFIIGQLVLNNSNVIGTPLPILFETVKLNNSAVQLYVKYSNTYALGCDFHYKFANTNQTYNNLASTVLDASRNQTSFIFNNFTNEVIDAKCFDINSPLNRTARTEITQTGFPMLDLIANFRNGTYGTMGQFGAFDMITLIVVMFSMVGMNRVNEAVGVIFCVAVIGGLSVVGVFGIITWPTALSGIVVLLIGLAIVTTRKD